ncbi:citrate synthase/methylcitrate synthase [Microbacterium protaetiae]|uniref:citrate synthase (unknown stereospecificity) n=1 Tax=Microbacterium protaetiae TaxID=2509458 RepID=A0A4P6ESR7_9MICO|nr:citrate/2-methylcitrate synthase [Microbacterium protaetiae]QAY61028.1 citrate synthase/methylcitrate synthase [Microbacterium protaetiae]
MNETEPVPVIAPRGLAGVVVADTAISDVRGAEGVFHYRGHNAVSLATDSTFEDVWHLMLFGSLPDAPARTAFLSQISRISHGDDLQTVLAAVLRADQDPISVLTAVWPLLASRRGMGASYGLGEAQRRDAALELAAIVPTVLAGCAGALPVPSGQGLVADHLTAMTGHDPDAWARRALTAYLILVMDHGFNASTFTARVIASTGAGMAACLTGALGALTGPLHGGAPARALEALDSFSEVSDIEPWVRAELAAGRRLMGFGHAVYRTVDPRSQLLRRLALEQGGPRVELAVAYERVAERVLAELKPGRALHANVELFAAVVMELCGIPRRFMTPTFAMARAVGWSAHALEQAADPKIIRPASRYVGPPLR